MGIFETSEEKVLTREIAACSENFGDWLEV